MPSAWNVSGISGAVPGRQRGSKLMGYRSAGVCQAPLTATHLRENWMENRRLGRSLGLLGMLAGLLLQGCAGMRELSDEDRANLLARAEQRWHAIEERDFGKAWEYTSPAYREVFPKSLYTKKFSYMVEWRLTGLEVLAYDARAAVASVAARVMSEPVKHTSAASAALGGIPTRQVEQWVLVDGQWWYSVTK